VRPRKSHSLLNVGDAGASRDERRKSIDVAIPNPPRALIRGVITHDQVAAQRLSKFRNLLVV
jgi:hypothetical protein